MTQVSVVKFNMTTLEVTFDQAWQRLEANRAALKLQIGSNGQRLVAIHNMVTSIGYILGMLVHPHEALDTATTLEQVQEHANALASYEEYFLEQLPDNNRSRLLTEDLGDPPNLAPSTVPVTSIIRANLTDAELHRQLLENHLELGYSPRQIFSELNKVVLESGKLLGQFDLLKTQFPELVEWGAPLRSVYIRLDTTSQLAISYILAAL